MKQQLTVILGPTGSGKTTLALELAKRQQLEIVSADSRQIYREMDIGTATPKNLTSGISGPEAKHHLINIRDPDDELSLAQWQKLAFEKIDQLFERGTDPLLVGGTMLYLDSVIDNYQIPKVNPSANLRHQLEQVDIEVLYQRLLSRDPAAAEFIQAGNRRRIIRALEVMEATGRPFSELRQKRGRRYEVEKIGLFPGWEELENRLKRRSRQMVVDGLIDETKGLIKKYGQDLPLLKTINYGQTLEYLDGQISESELIDAMTRANLRYARRQMSWWRRDLEIKWYESMENALAKNDENYSD